MIQEAYKLALHFFDRKKIVLMTTISRLVTPNGILMYFPNFLERLLFLPKKFTRILKRPLFDVAIVKKVFGEGGFLKPICGLTIFVQKFGRKRI